MQSILEQITDWLKSMINSGIMGNLSGMFDSVNQQVGQIAGDVGTTPANFSPAEMCIRDRYKSGLPVIITTNLKIAEIRNPQDVAYARIYSRILAVSYTHLPPETPTMILSPGEIIS